MCSGFGFKISVRVVAVLIHSTGNPNSVIVYYIQFRSILLEISWVSLDFAETDHLCLVVNISSQNQD